MRQLSQHGSAILSASRPNTCRRKIGDGCSIFGKKVSQQGKSATCTDPFTDTNGTVDLSASHLRQHGPTSRSLACTCFTGALNIRRRLVLGRFEPGTALRGKTRLLLHGVFLEWHKWLWVEKTTVTCEPVQNVYLTSICIARVLPS